MQCKKCKSELPDELHFVFCGYCGERLIRERKKKGEITVPKARQRGKKWYIELRREGVTVTEETEAAAKAKAVAIRAGYLDVIPKRTALTLRNAIDNYIAERDNALSPSTISGYVGIQRNAFPDVMDKDIHTVKNWQAVVNSEAKRISAKTLKNEWGLVKSVLDKNNVQYNVTALPQVVRKELPWLDHEQIKIFLLAVRGQKCELGALLALHSLRRSELLALTPDSISDGIIHVAGSVVRDKTGKLVRKSQNKNVTSRRDVPIVIPRLSELLEAQEGIPDSPLITCNSNTLWEQINTVCARAGLPKVGVHGLRRSFASLAYHLHWSERQTMATGGWSDLKTVHNIYIKLSEADENADINRMKDFYR